MSGNSVTHKFSIGGHEGYITAGLYEDGSWWRVVPSPPAKECSTISGPIMDSFATAISYALQYGVPLKFFVDKFSHVRFAPGRVAGPTLMRRSPTPNPSWITFFRWLGAKFLGPEYAAGEAGLRPLSFALSRIPSRPLPFAESVSDAPTCSECGGVDDP